MAGHRSSLFLQLLDAAAPDIGCAADIVVLAVHSMILGYGFTCTETDTGDSADVIRPDPPNQSTSNGAIYRKVLPGGWSTGSREGGAYNFCYSHPSWQWDSGTRELSRQEPDKSLPKRHVRLKALAVGGQLMFHTVDSAHSECVLSFELRISDALSNNSFQELSERALEKPEYSSLCDERFLEAMGRAQSMVHKKLVSPILCLDGDTKSENKDSRSQGREAETCPSNGGPSLRIPLIEPSVPGMFAPDGNLIGPNHPAWGATRPGIPGRGGNPSGIPGVHFDPLGPLGPFGAEPDPDHLPRPGIGRDMFF